MSGANFVTGDVKNPLKHEAIAGLGTDDYEPVPAQIAARLRQALSPSGVVCESFSLRR
jgi:hypothetical protein